jgi:hypothetical protein
MRFPIALAVLVVAFSSTTPLPAHAEHKATATKVHAGQDFSAAKRSKKRVRGYQAYGSSGRQQIACTQLGCNPIPRGCRVVPGRIPFTWDPSGFDEVQCPYYR